MWCGAWFREKVRRPMLQNASVGFSCRPCPLPKQGPTRRQSQRQGLSRVVLTHAPRQPPSWLIFDVRQRMSSPAQISFAPRWKETLDCHTPWGSSASRSRWEFCTSTFPTKRCGRSQRQRISRTSGLRSATSFGVGARSRRFRSRLSQMLGLISQNEKKA